MSVRKKWGKGSKAAIPMLVILAAGMMMKMPVQATGITEDMLSDMEEVLPKTEVMPEMANSGICGTNMTWSYDSTTKQLTISGTGNMANYTYNSVAPWYDLRENIKSLIVVDGVTSIGEHAFEGCSSLSSIELPEGLTSIGNHAFYGCISLSSIELPEGLTSIGNHVFYGCSSLSSIELPDGLTGIGEYVFYGCSGLNNIELPEGLTSIGEGVFRACSSLCSIELPEGLTDIGGYAFYDCGSLSSIELPDGVTSIGYGTFYGCISLSSIKLPDGLATIDNYAFYKCISLSSIELPDGVTSIGECAFRACSSLSSIELPGGLTNIRYGTFYGCSGLRNIELPDGLMHIGGYAFYDCSSLSSIELPGGVTSVDGYAFHNCSNMKIAITSCSWKSNPLYQFDSKVSRGYNHTGNIVVQADDELNTISVHCNECSTTDMITLEIPTDRIYTGSPIVASVSSSDVFYTPTVTYVGTNLADGKPVNAGIYTVIMSVNTPMGKKSVSLDYEIEKAEYTPEEINKSYLYRRENAEDFDLTVLIPADCGTVSWFEPQTEGTVTYSEIPAIENGRLNYTLNAGEPGAQGIIKVAVSSGNYKDFDIIVNVRLHAQTPIRVKEGTEVTLKNNTLILGEALSVLEFLPATFENENGNEVTGTLAWKEPQTVPPLGTQSATWIFIPDNQEYATLEGSVAIIVNQITDAPNKPASAMKVPFAIRKVSEVALPENWAWKTEDADKVLKPEEPLTVTAVYIGADKEKYKTTSVEVIITRDGKEWIFTDVAIIPGQWKYEAVKYVYNNDIMNGISGTTEFRPDIGLNRAMFATVLYRMAGSPQVQYEDVFTDVAPGKYYTEAILWAKQKGIVNGFSDGSYGVETNITREQIAKMLCEYATKQGYDVSGKASLDTFTDKDSVSGWATGYMQWAVNAGMISGKPNGDDTFRLDPKGNATRAECAKMLKYFIQKYQGG